MRSDRVNYSTHEYSPTHWARDVTQEGACVAFIKCGEFVYSFQLNPTDSRCVRGLIKLCGREGDFLRDNGTDISETFNRPYTTAESCGLLQVTAFMKAIYQSLSFPIVQTAEAGNNVHSIDADTKTINIGNVNEPSLLHMHIWGRGLPTEQYIPGIPLNGPALGKIFDMMGKTPDVPGNDKKIPWEEQQLSATLNAFIFAILAYNKQEECKVSFPSLSVKLFKLGMFQDIKESMFEATEVAGTLFSRRM